MKERLQLFVYRLPKNRKQRSNVVYSEKNWKHIGERSTFSFMLGCARHGS